MSGGGPLSVFPSLRLAGGLAAAIAATACAPPPASPPIPGARPLEHVFTGVTAESEDDEGFATMRAPEVVYRTRTGAGGFVVYYDLAELVIGDAALSLEQEKARGFAPIVSRLEEVLQISSREVGLRDVEGPRLTRVLFRDLSIASRSGGQDFQLRAEHAALDLESDTLLLYGRVAVDTAGGYELRARRAVMSPDQEGLYLPRGHQVGANRFGESSFLLLDSEGRPSHAVLSTRGLEYADLIEERERLVLRHYADRAPDTLKPLLLAILTQVEANARLH